MAMDTDIADTVDRVRTTHPLQAAIRSGLRRHRGSRGEDGGKPVLWPSVFSVRVKQHAGDIDAFFADIWPDVEAEATIQ
jgi:hypothetical protein